MPWKENSVSDMRVQFIALFLRKELSFTDLCKHFSISRVTGYKFVERYESFGPVGLADQSRAPYSHPNSTPEAIQNVIIDLKNNHEHWGPKKLRARLLIDRPDVNWPVASTIGDLLKSKNLVVPRHRPKPGPPAPTGLCYPDSPNSVWTADFKGEFRLTNTSLCYPLTICDRNTRMLLACNALPSTATVGAKAVWITTFREYGLPRVIRSDNGTPFASVGIGGLSRLSAWWIRLGILPERIAPGKPQQNGSHERMHRTLKAEVASKPQASFKSQQQAFNYFVHEYNYIRPHEALGQVPPATIYSPSPREYPLILPQLQYPADMTVRHVRTNGQIRWRGELLFLSEVLAGEHVAFEQIDAHSFAFYYGPLPIAILDDSTRSWARDHKANKLLQELRKETMDTS